MNRALLRPLAVLGAGAGVTVLAALSPFLFRHFDAFRVRQVEVLGTQLMPAAEAFAASGITDSLSLFDDFDPLRQRLLGHRLVAGARLQRRLPGTLRILVTETEPVALVRGDELRAVDARGRLLPIETAGAEIDVPVLAVSVKVAAADSVIGPAAGHLLNALVALRGLDPRLAADVSEVDVADGGGIRLVMRWPGQPEILLPDIPSARTVSEVREVLEHLRNGAAGDSTAAGTVPIERWTRVDARYRDELFVSFHSR